MDATEQNDVPRKRALSRRNQDWLPRPTIHVQRPSPYARLRRRDERHVEGSVRISDLEAVWDGEKSSSLVRQWRSGQDYPRVGWVDCVLAESWDGFTGGKHSR